MWLMPSPVAFTVVSYVMFRWAVFCTILVMVPGIWLGVSDCLVCCRLHLFSYDDLREWLRFSSKQGLVTLPRFPQPSAPEGSRVTRPLLRGKMVFNWSTCCVSFGARWYRIDILDANILWLYYVDISLSYFPIEVALWANYLSAVWLFVFCSQMVKYCNDSLCKMWGFISVIVLFYLLSIQS